MTLRHGGGQPRYSGLSSANKNHSPYLFLTQPVQTCTMSILKILKLWKIICKIVARQRKINKPRSWKKGISFECNNILNYFDLSSSLSMCWVQQEIANGSTLMSNLFAIRHLDGSPIFNLGKSSSPKLHISLLYLPWQSPSQKEYLGQMSSTLFGLINDTYK